MKKRVIALALAALALLALAGCGANSDTATDSDVGLNYFGNIQEDSSGDAEGYGNSMVEMGMSDVVGAALTSTGSLDAEKIIYSAYAEIETLEFDETISGIYALIEACGGFLESSSINGNNYYTTYYRGQSSRSATFVLRVPSTAFESVTDSLTELGNVPYSYIRSENITSQYTDTKAMLDSYLIQQERLLEMLDSATTVEDMMSIEDRLTSVRYNIEILTSQLQNWDNEVNFSTVELNVSEVAIYTEETPVQQTYWESVSASLSNTLSSIGKFFKDLLKFLISAAPVLAIIAIVFLAVFFPVRARARRRRAKRALSSEPDVGAQRHDDM